MSDTGANAQPVIKADNWCKTVAGNPVKTTFMWIIENFNELPVVKDQYTESTKFSVTLPTVPDDPLPAEITEWNLLLFPKGKGEEGDDVSVCIYLNLCSASCVDARGSFSLVDSSEKEQITYPLAIQTYDINIDKRKGGAVIKLDELSNNSTLLPGGNLKLLCKLEVFGEAELYSGSKNSFNKTQTSDECQKQVISHLDNLFVEKNFSDFEITCDEEVFYCHRNILSARSPVFSAMIQADMIESRSQKVIIRDIEKSVFYEMLRFIYTGKVSSGESFKNQAREVLIAADKYQLDLLKNLCEAQLVSTLDGSNCVDLLLLGDLHQAANLKMAALDSVSMNLTSLIETGVYKDLHKQHPELAYEVNLSILSKKKSNNN